MKTKTLKTYVEKLKSVDLLVNHNLDKDTLSIEIDCVSYDSRNLSGKSLFICKGANFKEKYLKEALSKGTIAYISESQIDNIHNYIIVKNIREAIKHLAAFHYDFPAQTIKAIGVTGTKGKSSVVYMLKNIIDLYLKDNNKKASALISSIETYDGATKFESSLTTPEPIELQHHFYNAKNSGIEYMIMEVSSQALKFDRTFDIPFNVVCFTNFGKDHISDVEHPNMQDYFESKLKIFDNASIACINSSLKQFDDVYNYAKDKCKLVTFGANKNDDIFCSSVEVDEFSSRFHVKTEKFSEDFYVPIPGTFNVENCLAAIAISCSLNIPVEYIKKGLSTASVPGRMKLIVSEDKSLTIIVDYAHNESSFEALFDSANEQYKGSKMIAIFGCPGNKAQNRRIDLPKIASRFCDHIIICEEDSGTEPFLDIAKDIVSNIDIENYDVIEDREQALRKAVFDLANEKTVILFTGKGEETYLKRGKEYQKCDDDLFLAKKYVEMYNEKLGN